MNEQALMVCNDQQLSVSLSERAQALKDEALEKAALIGRVTCSEEQRGAVDAQKALAFIRTAVEKARKAAKERPLAYGRAIDEKAKEFVREIGEEDLRIAHLIADFQALEQARIRAAQQAENERLTQLERDRAKELAEAKTFEEVDRVQEHYNTLAQQESTPMPEVAKVEGQIVRHDWDITVTDIWLLARGHPSCVKIDPRLSEIKSLLDAGVKVSGVKAERIIKAQVRVNSVKAIEV